MATEPRPADVVYPDVPSLWMATLDYFRDVDASRAALHYTGLQGSAFEKRRVVAAALAYPTRQTLSMFLINVNVPDVDHDFDLVLEDGTDTVLYKRTNMHMPSLRGTVAVTARTIQGLHENIAAHLLMKVLSEHGK